MGRFQLLNLGGLGYGNRVWVRILDRVRVIGKVIVAVRVSKELGSG